jgi:uncharacterized membrane protein YqjE
MVDGERKKRQEKARLDKRLLIPPLALFSFISFLLFSLLWFVCFGFYISYRLLPSHSRYHDEIV